MSHLLEPLALDAQPALQPRDTRDLPCEHSNVLRRLHAVEIDTISFFAARLMAEQDRSDWLIRQALAIFEPQSSCLHAADGATARHGNAPEQFCGDVR